MAAALSARGLFDEEGGQGAEDECLNAAAEPVKIQAGNGGNANGQPGVMHTQTGENGENAQHRDDDAQNFQLLFLFVLRLLGERLYSYLYLLELAKFL